MGNENSTLIGDDEPTQTLESRDLAAVAKLIRDGKVKRIVVMTGAGISTAAGSRLYTLCCPIYGRLYCTVLCLC